MGSEGSIPARVPVTKDVNKSGSRGFIGVQPTNQVWAKGRGEYKQTNKTRWEGAVQGDQRGIEHQRTFQNLQIFNRVMHIQEVIHKMGRGNDEPVATKQLTQGSMGAHPNHQGRYQTPEPAHHEFNAAAQPCGSPTTQAAAATTTTGINRISSWVHQEKQPNRATLHFLMKGRLLCQSL